MERQTESPIRRGRPPRQVPGYGETCEALVRAGVELLSEKGFTATGLDEILRKVGVPKGSFYHYFASKTDFSLAIIDAYARYFAKKLDRTLGDTALGPLARLEAFMADARAGMARFEFRRGCVVGNLGQEIAVLPEEIRFRLQGVLMEWERRTAAVFAEAQRAGELSKAHDCERLAAFFWISWEGVVLRAKLERSPEPIDVFRENFIALIAQ